MWTLTPAIFKCRVPDALAYNARASYRNAELVLAG
jgi:hypothetical protein